MKYKTTFSALAIYLAGGLTVTVAAEPPILLQYSLIIGDGSTITVSRVPVNKGGNIVYRDIQIVFTTDGAGNLSLVGSPKITVSPKLNTENFLPGSYSWIVNSVKAQGAVTSGVGGGGSTVWDLSMSTNPSGSPVPSQASWQTGKPAANLLARLAAAKISIDPSYSYGTNGQSAPTTGCYGNFAPNGIIAAQQVGNSLTIYSFSVYNCGGGTVTDNSTPVASVVLTR